MKKFLCVGAAVFALVSGTAANAAALLFTVTGADNFSFWLADPSTPSGKYNSQFTGPTFYYQGVTVGTLVRDVTFYDAADGGGLSVGTLPGDNQGTVSYDLFNVAGKQLYAGTLSAPQFTPGSYSLHKGSSGGPSDTLVISTPAAAAVPEPASWAMMVGGFGLLGVALRRKKVSVSFA